MEFCRRAIAWGQTKRSSRSINYIKRAAYLEELKPGEERGSEPKSGGKLSHDG